MKFAEREGAGFGDVNGAVDGLGKFGEQPRHLDRRFEMAFGIDRNTQTRLANGAFLTDAGEDIGQRPTLRSVIGNVIDGDQRRTEAFAEFGQQAEPARFIAAMIMSAGKECAARRGAGQGGKALGESRFPFIPAKAGIQRWVPASAGTSGSLIEQRQRRHRDKNLAFA